MKKLIYIANIRLPTERAHGIQIMEMCAAFAHQGVEVELVVPKRFNNIKTDPFEYYHLDKMFKITQVPSLDLISFGKSGFLLQTFTFLVSVFLRVLLVVRDRKEIIFYSRQEAVASLLSILGLHVIWETHMGHDNIFVRFIISRNIPIIAITGGLRDLYVTRGAKKILVSPDAVDLDKFQIKDTQEEARKKLGLPKELKLIMYTGHLYSWKGVDILAESAKSLDADARIVFVGGMEKDITLFKEKYGHIKNIMILGNKPHQDIPLYLRAADVLIIPNSAREEISQLYTSPMKLFEYMASGTPIVASRLPSLIEVLNDENSTLVTSDDPEDLSRGIVDVLSSSKKSSFMALQALKDVEQYSWKKRAKNILNFILLGKS